MASVNEGESARSLPTRPTVIVLSSPVRPAGFVGALGFQSSAIQVGKFFRSSGRPMTADPSDGLASLAAFFKLTRTPWFLPGFFPFPSASGGFALIFLGDVVLFRLVRKVGSHSREGTLGLVAVAGGGTSQGDSQPHARPQREHSPDDRRRFQRERLPVDVRRHVVFVRRHVVFARRHTVFDPPLGRSASDGDRFPCDRIGAPSAIAWPRDGIVWSCGGLSAGQFRWRRGRIRFALHLPARQPLGRRSLWSGGCIGLRAAAPGGHPFGARRRITRRPFPVARRLARAVREVAWGKGQRRSVGRRRHGWRVVVRFGAQQLLDTLVAGAQVLDVFQQIGRRLVSIGRFARIMRCTMATISSGTARFKVRGSGRGLEMCA